MSETEKRQRAEYQQKRTRQIYIRSIILVILVVATLMTGMTANRLSQNSYVIYTEQGTADYQVYLKGNDFYSKDFLEKGYAYISVLVDEIEAQFDYSMAAQSKAEYNYSYYVDAKLEILDKDSGAAIFNPVYGITEIQSGTATDRTLNIAQDVSIDYHVYNDIAREFVSTYALDRPECNLIVTLHVNVDGTCPNVEDGQGKYDVSLRIPLNKTTVKIETNTSVPQAEAKVLACSNGGAKLMTILCVALAALAVVSAVLLVVYIVRTRDRHINYARQVKKILSSYKSYIQRIKDPFDTSNYQVLHVDTFPELLEIRDTLQMPILMFEDEDRTRAQFLIPSDAGLVYAYEVTVAGIYAQA